MGLFDLLKKKNIPTSESVSTENKHSIMEYDNSVVIDSVFYNKCINCLTILHAFRYYRNNLCSTYCEKCGNKSYACYATPYKTIELQFSGIQREGRNITIEIENYPSFEKADLCTYEWNSSGGIVTRVHLPADYIPTHTISEFIDDYILSKNEVTEKWSSADNEGLLNQIKNILFDSELFKNEVKKIKCEIIISQSKMGYWLCQSEDEFYFVFDAYDVNPKWLHTYKVDDEAKAIILNHTGDGLSLDKKLSVKYRIDPIYSDTIINRDGFLTDNTLIPFF